MMVQLPLQNLIAASIVCFAGGYILSEIIHHFQKLNMEKKNE